MKTKKILTILMSIFATVSLSAQDDDSYDFLNDNSSQSNSNYSQSSSNTGGSMQGGRGGRGQGGGGMGGGGMQGGGRGMQGGGMQGGGEMGGRGMMGRGMQGGDGEMMGRGMQGRGMQGGDMMGRGMGGGGAMGNTDRISALKKYDEDGDGVLSSEEKAKMQEELNSRRDQMGAMIEERAKMSLERFDKDEDSKLDITELTEMLKSQYGASPSSSQPRMPQEIIEKYDADGDGTLSRDELETMRNDTKKIIEELSAKYDTDGDGELSQSERQKMMEENPDVFRGPMMQNNQQGGRGNQQGGRGQGNQGGRGQGGQGGQQGGRR